MSGPGGSGGGGGGLVSSETECLRLIIRTPLNSPVPMVIARLTKGDKLSLEVRGERGPVVAIDTKGDVAGSITDERLLDLIGCINDGHVYVAIVTNVERGKVDVEIRPVTK